MPLISAIVPGGKLRTTATKVSPEIIDSGKAAQNSSYDEHKGGCTLGPQEIYEEFELGSGCCFARPAWCNAEQSIPVPLAIDQVVIRITIQSRIPRSTICQP